MHEFSINGFSGEQAATFNKVLLEYAFSDDEFKLHELFSASAFASPQDAGLNLDWGDLMHGRSVAVALRPETPIEFEVLPERTKKLALELRADPDLARFAVRRSLEKPAEFDQGVYGKLGTSTVYMAPIHRVRSSDRLYWTMVRVLSEKYGCFIVEKNRDAERFQFRCRDGRMVVMQRKIDSRVAHFWGRQYNANGDEVKVLSRATPLPMSIPLRSLTH